MLCHLAALFGLLGNLIGFLIGPGGKTIRGIQERTGATIDVEEDGTVYIASTDAEAGQKAKAEVESLGAEIKVGAVYEGKVVATKDMQIANRRESLNLKFIVTSSRGGQRCGRASLDVSRSAGGPAGMTRRGPRRTAPVL